MQKTFFLCVGAQRSGTTWLHQYLSKYPNFNFGFLKEYHIWDSLYITDFKNNLPDKSNLRYKLLYDVKGYENYFLSLLSKSVTCTGDFTPSYCGLTSENFHAIKTRLNNVGFNIKVLFLMRDPFERCWSMARMDAPSNDAEYLKNFYNNNNFFLRTNYKNTINNLESVFTSDQIYYGIFEEMFNLVKLKELSDFCDVPMNWAYRKKNVNCRPKISTIPNELKQEVITFYKDTYTYCNHKFPQTKELWSSII